MNRYVFLAIGLIASGGIAQAGPVGIYLNDTTLAGAASGNADYATGPGVTIFSVGGLHSSLDAFSSVNPTSMPLGLYTASLTVTSINTITGSPATATSAANLAQGAMRVQSDSNGSLIGCGGTCMASGNRAIAISQLFDTVTFTITDAAPSAPVTVHIHMGGSVDPGASAESFFSDNLQMSFLSVFSFSGNSGGFAASPGSWVSSSFSDESATGFDFTGVANVTNGQVAPLITSLQTDCSASANCNFLNTGAISLELPSDVTFSSASGLFLTQPLSESPEPGTLVLAGVALVAMSRLRRRRKALRL